MSWGPFAGEMSEHLGHQLSSASMSDWVSFILSRLQVCWWLSDPKANSRRLRHHRHWKLRTCFTLLNETWRNEGVCVCVCWGSSYIWTETLLMTDAMLKLCSWNTVTASNVWRRFMLPLSSCLQTHDQLLCSSIFRHKSVVILMKSGNVP